MAIENKNARISGTNANRLASYGLSGWSSAAVLPETRGYHFMCGGNKNSAIQTQGSKTGSDRYKNTTYLFNGTAWSSGNNNSYSKDYGSGGGTQSGAISVMGYDGSNLQSTQKYNGSTWSNGGNTGNSFYNLIADGNDSSAIEAQGTTGGSTKTNNAATYNGSSWSSITACSNQGFGGQGGGTSSNFHITNSYDASSSINVGEKWNGSSWSASTNPSTPRYDGQGGGNSSAGFISGGYAKASNSYPKDSELWNGSSWTTKESMPEIKVGASHTSTGSLTASSGAIVTAGHGDTSWAFTDTTFIYAPADPINLQEGVTFEESDTGKNYVWYGSTWVEIPRNSE